MKVEDLVAGDWIEFDYGFDRLLFYVVNNGSGFIRLGQRTWLVSSNILLRHGELKVFSYVGRGVIRWWWKLLPFRDTVCPFSAPKNIWWV